jgi:mycofactocin system glycosyltransferase
VIPLIYTLRKQIRFERQGESWIVASETPLNVLRVSDRAADVLRLCNGTRTLKEIAETTNMIEEQVFRLCDYFNKRAILEIGPAAVGDYFPFVSIIIPTKDRREEVVECLGSVFAQDYPKDKMEVIVIDDGSSDGTGNLVRTFPCRLISNNKSRGQSYSRNLGAKEAQGEILAFLDSDCVPEKTWLQELVTYFQWERIGAVGGYVDGYFEATTLDRYEKAFSPLNMGMHILCGTNNSSTFYAPTCNLLVRRQAFIETGGIRESMHVGEDVDFCWRLRKKGYDALYIPRGIVKHRHRNCLGKMLKRRGDYGTSEAILYGIHPEKKKVFQLPPLAASNFLALIIALMSMTITPLLIAVGCFVFETAMKLMRISKMNLNMPLWRILFSVVRSHCSFFYFASFHVIRYYMVTLIVLGFFFHSVWFLLFLMVLLSSTVDYSSRRPRLVFPLFLFYYVLDHLSYQSGVFTGCVRDKTFGSYVPKFIRRIMTAHTFG